jgi:hypothetical protein
MGRADELLDTTDQSLLEVVAESFGFRGRNATLHAIIALSKNFTPCSLTAG